MDEKKTPGFVSLDERKLLALCLYGEARGEPFNGKIAVAWVVLNRARKGGWFGRSIREVILKPRQFSCFNPSDPNYLKLHLIAADWDGFFQKDKALRDCVTGAEVVIAGTVTDPTQGATHYKTLNCSASWAQSMNMVARIGNHEFYKEPGARHKEHLEP